jgi:rod shape-determining protein MreD
VKEGALWLRFDRFGRNLLPLAVTLCLVLFSAVPVPISGYAVVVPLFPLCAVYFWTINRPQALPPAVVFALGLIQDVLSGTSLGLHAVMLLLAYGMVISQRRFFIGKSFGVIWWGFMLVALIAIVTAWLLASIATGAVIRPGPAGFQFLLTLALYPVMALILIGAQRLMPPPA